MTDQLFVKLTDVPTDSPIHVRWASIDAFTKDDKSANTLLLLVSGKTALVKETVAQVHEAIECARK